MTDSSQDGVSLRQGPKVDILYDGQGGSTVTLSDVSHTVTDGWYQVTAVNTAGSTVTRARLHVVPPPQPPFVTQAAPYHLHIPHTGRIIEPE